MSTAVPNVVTVEMNASSAPSSARRRSGTAISPATRSGTAPASPRGYEASSACSAASAGSPVADRLAPEPVEQVRAPLPQVRDPRRQPLGMQPEPQHVHRRLEQVRRRRPRSAARSSGSPATIPQWRSTTTAGYGSWPASTASIAARTGSSSGSSKSRCP